MKKNKRLIIALSIMLVLFGLVIYEYGHRRLQEEIDSTKALQDLKIKTLQKQIALISEKPQLEKSLQSLKETAKAEESKLIEGQTSTLAAANLEGRVRAIITGRGGTISNARIGKPEVIGRFKAISVTFDVIIPNVSVLSSILYSIETSMPYLRIKELDVSVRHFREPGQELLVKMEISGLALGR